MLVLNLLVENSSFPSSAPEPASATASGGGGTAVGRLPGPKQAQVIREQVRGVHDACQQALDYTQPLVGEPCIRIATEGESSSDPCLMVRSLCSFLVAAPGCTLVYEKLLTGGRNVE